MPPITHRHLFGWKCETALKNTIEQLLEDTLVKTNNRFNTIDFLGNNWIVELKSRPKLTERNTPQTSETFKEWLVPTCKTYKLGDYPDKDYVIFYYWEGDNSLWYIIYNKEEFDTFTCGVPFWSNQEHFWIPSDKFTKLDVQIPPIV